MRATRQGKGNRQRPWRDGGAKKKNTGNWKLSVPNSIEEYEIAEPILRVNFEFYESNPVGGLSNIDNAMQEKSIPYSIQSRGKTGVSGIAKFSKYTITCSAKLSELVVSAITEAGGNVQNT